MQSVTYLARKQFSPKQKWVNNFATSPKCLLISLTYFCNEATLTGSSPFFSGISVRPKSLIAPSWLTKRLSVSGFSSGKDDQEKLTSSPCGVSSGRSAITTPPPSSTSRLTWQQCHMCVQLSIVYTEMIIKSETDVSWFENSFLCIVSPLFSQDWLQTWGKELVGHQAGWINLDPSSSFWYYIIWNLSR